MWIWSCSSDCFPLFSPKVCTLHYMAHHKNIKNVKRNTNNSSYKPEESLEHGITCRPLGEVCRSILSYNWFLDSAHMIDWLIHLQRYTTYLFCTISMNSYSFVVTQGPLKRKPVKLSQLEIDGLKLRSEKMFEVLWFYVFSWGVDRWGAKWYILVIIPYSLQERSV